jgi:hypothetical protein
MKDNNFSPCAPPPHCHLKGEFKKGGNVTKEGSMKMESKNLKCVQKGMKDKKKVKAAAGTEGYLCISYRLVEETTILKYRYLSAS